MKKLFYKTSFLFVFMIVVCISCKDGQVFNTEFEPSDTLANLPNLRTVNFNYEKIVKIPYSITGELFAKSKDIFVIGSAERLLSFNTTTQDYFYKLNTQDPIYSRNRSVLINSGDSLILVGTPNFYEHDTTKYNLISVQPTNLESKSLSKKLPIKSAVYYIYGTVKDDVAYIQFNTLREMYTLNLNTMNFEFFMYGSSILNLNESDHIINTYQNNVIFYSGGNKRICKIDVNSKSIQTIETPDYVIDRINLYPDYHPIVALIKNYVCYWPYDKDLVFCYDLDNNEWCKGDTNYFKNADLNNWSYCYDNGDYYHLDHVTKEIIKVDLK